MIDQARSLRSLIERRRTSVRPLARRAGRTIAFVSGKGGVGKSVLALNLAVGLSRQGLQVALLDASSGVGNTDLLCGLNGYWNLAHVISGGRLIDDVRLDGPAGVQVYAGAGSLAEIARLPLPVQHQLLSQFDEWESRYDVLLIDTGRGHDWLQHQMAQVAHDIFVVTNPEPTSVADAYATVKSLQGCRGAEISVLVNQSTPEQAAAILERIQVTARSFLNLSLSLGMAIPGDVAVPESVRQRRPFVELSGQSPASRALQRLAERLVFEHQRSRGMPAEGYFERLWPRLQAAGSPLR